MNCVCAEGSCFSEKKKKKGIPEVRRLSPRGGGENIRRCKRKVAKMDRRSDGVCKPSRRRELWLKARDGEKEKEKESGGRTLAWGSATCCASSGDSERRKEKGGKKTERTKTHFSCIPVGVLKPAAPHIAAPI